jgi:hypothetical protein
MVSVYDRRTCISLDNVALLRVLLRVLLIGALFFFTLQAVGAFA